MRHAVPLNEPVFYGAMAHFAAMLWLADSQAAQHFDPRSLVTIERTRYECMRSAARRQQFATSRALLQQVRKQLSGVAAASNAAVSPVLSHSGPYAVAALDPRAAALGVDVEVMRSRDFLRIATGNFASAECTQLRTLTMEAQARHFYCLWTLKEAFAKALRIDLLQALRDCVFLKEETRWVAAVPSAASWRASVWQPREALLVSMVSIVANNTPPNETTAPEAITTLEWPNDQGKPWLRTLSITAP
jgi:4'-phosphopantetheinyl transferase